MKKRIAIFVLCLVLGLSVMSPVFAAEEGEPAPAPTLAQEKKIGKKYGPVKVKGKYYIYDKNGKRAKGSGKRIVNIGDGNKYYVDKKGKAVPGLHYLSDIKKVIYANKKGQLARSETVDDLEFNKKGYCTITNKGRAKIMAGKFIKKHTKSGWSKKEKFRACWRYIIANNRYIAINRPKKYFRKNWVWRVAVDMFETGLLGDCNGIACAAAAVAKELGYTPYVIRSTNQHCFVKANGLYYDNMYGAVFGRKTRPKYTIREKIKF